MAGTSPMDNFEIHQENDFEKISAPGSGSDQEGDGLVPPADGPQVGEVSTTSDGNHGEIDIDDDQFNMIGASDVEGFIADPIANLDNTNANPQSQFQPPDSDSRNDAENAGAGAYGIREASDSKTVVADLLGGSGEQSDNVIEKEVGDGEKNTVDLLVGGGEIPSHSYSEQPDILDFDNENMFNSNDNISQENEGPPSHDNLDVIESMLTQSSSDGLETEAKKSINALNEGNNDLISQLGVTISDISQVDSQENVDGLSPCEPETAAIGIDSNEADIGSSPHSSETENIPEPQVLNGAAQSFVPNFVNAEIEKEPIANVENHQADTMNEAAQSFVSGILNNDSEENENVRPTANVNSHPANLSGPTAVEADATDIFIKHTSASTEPTESLIQQSDEQLDSKVDQLSEQISELTEETATEGNWLKGVDPRVVELIYWRDPKKTGIVFGVMLASLLSLAMFSLVSVLAYLSLAALTVSFSFVVYKKIMAAVQKSNDGHPFKCVLEMDLTLSEDKLKSVIQALLQNLNKTVSELRRLFFIEDMVDSIKFGLLLWVSTYLGCCLNGITLVILALIALFTLPKVYETYQVQIDNYVGLARAQINNVMTTVTNKLPFLKKKEKAN